MSFGIKTTFKKYFNPVQLQRQETLQKARELAEETKTEQEVKDLIKSQSDKYEKQRKISGNRMSVNQFNPKSTAMSDFY
jgi:hypothetical protein